MGMKEFASHVLAVGKKNNLPVTNLQLQKVMFFALGFYIQDNGRDDIVTEIYDTPFAKWQYGPVVESIYYAYSAFRSRDITEEDEGILNDTYNDFNEMISDLLRLDVFNLVHASHELPSWKDYASDIMKINHVKPYSLEEIERDFKDA